MEYVVGIVNTCSVYTYIEQYEWMTEGSFTYKLSGPSDEMMN